MARGLVFCDCLASQTHIPTRNRYLVSSKGVKVHVSVWGHREDSFLHACVQDAPSWAPGWGRSQYQSLTPFSICLFIQMLSTLHTLYYPVSDAPRSYIPMTGQTYFDGNWSLREMEFLDQGQKPGEQELKWVPTCV